MVPPRFSIVSWCLNRVATCRGQGCVFMLHLLYAVVIHNMCPVGDVISWYLDTWQENVLLKDYTSLSSLCSTVLEYNHVGLTFMGPCIVNVFYQVYQQDVTLYSILYYCQWSTSFRRFLRPSSGAQNGTHSIWYMSSLLVATASGSSKQAWHISDAVCTVLSSWWWAEKPSETCRAWQQ